MIAHTHTKVVLAVGTQTNKEPAPTVLRMMWLRIQATVNKHAHKQEVEMVRWMKAHQYSCIHVVLNG
jgi:hypothetical protein